LLFNHNFEVMNYILFDSPARHSLLPFTHTRPVADIRCGILSMRERWERVLGQSTGTFTADHLQKVFPATVTDDTIYINGSVFGNKELAAAIADLQPGEVLGKPGIVIAARVTDATGEIRQFNDFLALLETRHYDGFVYALNNIWDIFTLNERAIKDDFALVTEGRESAPVPAGVTVSGHPKHLFIEPGASIYPGCIINAATGPVYIGRQAEVLEGAMMRGPIAICDHGVVKMGAKFYGATTIGPGCKVGGELSNVVFFANSNKSHDGYLGNSVIGEWCNLGADTNCSNLKNNYDVVKVWDEATGTETSTGTLFCGLLMGDHSKCGINTMFNTGTVVGVASNIYGGGFPDKHIPSFSWGGSDGFTIHRFEKAIETANRMMGRRDKSLSGDEIAMLQHVYNNRKQH
jgi:UDP-N-acetylglucosamine diphosphorylase/glucosamine-1-phosphate N-acetyltransferase